MMIQHYIKLNVFLSRNFLIHEVVVSGYFKIHRNLRGGGRHLPSSSVARMKNFHGKELV